MRFAERNILRIVVGTVLASLLLLGVKPLIFPAGAAQFPTRSITLSENVISTTARYKFAIDVTTPAVNLGSIVFEFCSNTPLIGDVCDTTGGPDLSAATLEDEQNNTGFSIDGGAPSNQLLLTRTADAVTTGMSTYEFDGIVNPAAAGTYFIRVQTFETEDATGPATDYGGLAYDINDRGVDINTYVPPFLQFCLGVTISGTDCTTASGSYLNFGELSSNRARTGSTQMVAITNGTGGYVITINGTTMLSGTNAIPALTTNDVSRPGNSQFGVNLRANNDPSIGSNPSGPGNGAVKPNYAVTNRYHFVSGEQVASSPVPDEFRKYTTSYITNIAKDQPPGIYVSTITYVCTATF